MTSAIDRFHPSTGRLLKENGELFNVADFHDIVQKYSLTYETINNSALSATKVLVGLSQSDLYCGLSVPEGKTVVLYNRNIKLDNGKFLISVYAGNFTDGTSFLINPYRTNADINFSSTFKYDVGVTLENLTLLEETLLVTGSGLFSQRLQGGISEDGAFKMFVGPISGVIRINRLSGTGDWNAGLQWSAWEVDSE